MNLHNKAQSNIQYLTPFAKIDRQLKLYSRILKHFNQARKSIISKEKLFENGKTKFVLVDYQEHYMGLLN
ncbi:MAG: hypothetical protein ACI9N1_001592 [Flavobacteriales bacterium]|jgi:hypothetical protein